MRKTRIITGVCVVALLAAVSIVKAGAGNPQRPAVGPEVDAADAFPKAWHAAAPSADDPLTHELTETAIRLGQADGQVAISIHWRGGERVYTAIGTRVACLGTRAEDGSGSVGCSPTDSARRADRPIFAVDVLSGGRYQVSGLLADGNDGVRVTLRDGKTLPAELVDNIVSVRVAQKPQAVAWHGADNAQHRQNVDG